MQEFFYNYIRLLSYFGAAAIVMTMMIFAAASFAQRHGDK